MKKITALILAVLTVAAVLASCGGGGSGSVTTGGKSTEGVNTDELGPDNILSTLEKRKYDGDEFRIVCTNDFNGSIFVRQAPTDDADPSDRLNSSLYNRDRKLEETYGITITYDIRENDIDKLPTYVYGFLSAGESAGDLVLGSLSYAGVPFMNENYLLDLNSIPSLDLGNDWWNHNMTDYFTINDKTFLATGDITTRAVTSTTLYAFDHKLFTDNNIAFPYEDVFAGTWTYEKMYNIYRGASRDLDNNGEITYESTDIVGNLISGNLGDFFGCGGCTVKREKDGTLTSCLTSESNINIIQKLSEWNDTDCVTANGYSAIDCFKENRAFFLGIAGCDLSLLRSMDDDFGVLPTPKYDEKQAEYLNFANVWITTCALIPYTVPDPDFSGFMTEAMAALSKYTSSVEQYEVLMLEKELRDDESKKVLEICAKAAMFDLGYVFKLADAPTTILNILTKGYDPASRLEKISDKFDNALEELINNYK